MSENQYEAVIGLEVHAQLMTASKLLCSDGTTFGDSPDRHAVVFEIKGQIKEIGDGETISQDTRTYDEVVGSTISIRSKELANDYQNFPEPDLPPVLISEEMIKAIKKNMHLLPEQIKHELVTAHSLSVYDANILTEEKETTDYYFAVVSKTKNYKAAANWIIGPVRNYLNEHSVLLQEFPLSPESIASLIWLIDENKVSFTMASRKIFPELIHRQNSSPKQLAKELGVLQESGEEIMKKFVQMALDNYPDKINEYKKGKKGVLGLFMGDAMKFSKGTADSKMAERLLLEQLESK
ncbi:MAG: hypothetical protein ABIO46_11555 [Chitinophagales bacterium]